MSRSPRSVALSERLFALLVRLFPLAFRESFGDDMRELFRDQLRDAERRHGTLGVTRVWLRTLPSLAHAAVLERRDAIRDSARTRRAIAAADTSFTSRRDSVLETLVADLRFAGRMLRKSPVFTAVAIVVISLGSGAVTTIFSAMNAVVLRPLPGTTGGARLVLFERRTPDFSEGVSGSYAYYRHIRDNARTLDGTAAWSKVSLSISTGGEGAAIYGNIVSGNYFSVLGVRPALGRFFAPDEDRTPLAHPVVVVSHSFWESHLGADSSVIGKPVSVNGQPYTLIGVAPPGFRGVFTPLKTDAWVPLMMQAQLRPTRDLTDSAWLWLFGRLEAGTSRDAARRELASLTAAWLDNTSEPAGYRTYSSIRLTDLTGLPDDARNAFLGFTTLLFGAAALVLLIASVNVASMLSARAIARRREMALRTALGAARGRLVRQLLTESLMLFVIGAAGGMAIAWAATGALEQIPLPGDASLSLELSPDPRVFGFALITSLVTGIVFGLAPALQGVGKDITSRLRNDTAGSGARRSLASNALIVGQLALSLVLLVAAGLFIRALDSGSRIDPGFQVSGVATSRFNAEAWGYDSTKAQAFYETLHERVAALPGVTAVTLTDIVPLANQTSGSSIQLDGATGTTGTTANDGARLAVQVSIADPGYFDVVRLPIVLGRAFTPSDDARAPRVAIVNETLAKRLAPDGNAIGRTFGYDRRRVTVVGIARDSKYGSLTEQVPAYVYTPTAQSWRSDLTLMVRSAVDPASLAPAIRDIVREIDPTLPRPLVRTLQQETSIVLFPHRIAAIVTGVLGGVGLMLAAVGLYGIIAYSVSRRTREIGVRVALGAQRGDVLGMVVREGMRLAGTGVAVGLVLAAIATRLIAGFLFSVSPMDGATFAAMSGVFIAVALLASYLPARRAAATDPLTALRSD
ncbi:MAG TPA: ABC transporter permease [Gemmatimonadaceae bacterium]|nr:ABC transporter permease [Gemmatimonadaceae bacterium]